MPYNEQIFVINEDDESTTTKFIPRELLRRVSTPQAYKFELLYTKYQEAYKKEIGIYGSLYKYDDGRIRSNITFCRWI